MKKIITILCIALTFNGFAQDSNKGKALLKEVSEKVKSYDNIAIDFKYVLENTAEDIKQEYQHENL